MIILLADVIAQLLGTLWSDRKLRLPLRFSGDLGEAVDDKSTENVGLRSIFGMIKALSGKSFMGRKYIAFDQTDSGGEN